MKPGMYDITEAERIAEELNGIVSNDGKWLNIQALTQNPEMIGQLLEHIKETKAYLEEILNPEYPDQQRVLNFEYEQAAGKGNGYASAKAG